MNEDEEGERVLVVGARARWRPVGADRDAIVHYADGHVVAEATLGYGPHHDRLSVGTLDSEDLRITDEYRLKPPNGRPLPKHTPVIGRGPDLHVLSGNDWYRLGLEDIPHATP
ncbi:hypothetical protein ACWFRM_35790 [Streptomyces sp. NPDC055144]